MWCHAEPSAAIDRSNTIEDRLDPCLRKQNQRISNKRLAVVDAASGISNVRSRTIPNAAEPAINSIGS